MFNLIYDLSLARLGRGGQRVALSSGCPRHMGVTLIWRAPAGHRRRAGVAQEGYAQLKVALPSSPIIHNA